MLVDTIEFDYKGTRFTVENTEDNLMLVNSNPFTRQIQFSQIFDWQAERTFKRAPKFIQFGDAVLDALQWCLDEDSDGIDYGDVMA